MPGTLVETWQADASSRNRHRKDTCLGALDPGFGGCRRALTDAEGRSGSLALRPGA